MPYFPKSLWASLEEHIRDHFTNMKQVTITIDPEGNITLEAHGFKGASCETATAALEKALGKAGPRKKKPEYYQTSATVQKIGGAK